MEANEKSFTANDKPDRVVWIDFLKVLAIFAVFVDHTNNFLYTNQRIAYLSYFSVTLFVLLSGINSYSSYERKTQRGKNISWKTCEGIKLKKIILPYIIATGCYLIFNFKVLDLKTFISSLLNFNASPPFYFIVFYAQLIVITRPLYYLIKSTSELKRPSNIYIYIRICGICSLVTCIDEIYLYFAGLGRRSIFIRRNLFAGIFFGNVNWKGLS